MIPPVASDPDPTTQIPWPSTRGRVQESGAPGAIQEEGGLTVPTGTARKARSKSPPGRRQLSTWDLITLSISMAGAQIAWTVELGYGTPFLLELGLPAQLTSLVWLAGPISGLVAQPVIGALSDNSTSKYRRRFWIFLSTGALVTATLVLAYCQPLARFFVDFFRVGQGDWDEKRKHENNIAIGLAILCFYVLDFALNGLQASLRNLLLDVTPPNQLNAGNAWHGRMTNAGNIVGYGFGFLPLAELPIIRHLGGGQFRKFCVICIAILSVTVGMTCYCHEEQESPVSRRRTQKRFIDVLNDIYRTLITLPHAIRRVCLVQLFAFMGWFPFLFYSTTYVGQVMAYEIGKEPDAEFATRMGERAMLFYSIVGVVAGTVLPHLATRDRRILARYDNETQDEELNYLRKLVREWRVESARQGQTLRLPMMPFLLRNIWTGAMLLFSLLSFSTFFISTVFQATIFIMLVGVCWAVAMWVPFAIIMELLKDPPAPTPGPFLQERRPSHSRNLSTPANPRRMSRRAADERRPLLRRRSQDDLDSALDIDSGGASLAGGTVLGIHNLAIVMPQFIVAIVTSAIFRAVDGAPPVEGPGHESNTYYGHTGVSWVLRFGGLCTLFGALIARMVPPTPTEKAMRRRLGEMKLLGEEPNP